MIESSSNEITLIPKLRKLSVKDVYFLSNAILIFELMP